MFEIFSYALIVLGLSVLVVIHEAGHFFAAKLSGILVEEFGFGLPPRIIGKKFGETLVSLNWLPFGGFVRLYGEQHEGEASNISITKSFSHQPLGRRAFVIVAGVLMNFILGWLLFSAVSMIGIPQSLVVTEIRSGSPAESAGFQKGDQILDFLKVSELTNLLNKQAGTTITLRIMRGSKELMVPVTLKANTTKEERHLGVYLVEAGTPKMSFFRSIISGFSEAVQTTKAIFRGLIDLFAGLLTRDGVLDKFMGPVGIVNVAAQTAKLGAANFFQLLAVLSLNLAVFNILPFPALDGGRLVFLLIEGVTGRKMNQKFEAIFNAAGFFILLLLIVIVTAGDILKLL